PERGPIRRPGAGGGRGEVGLPFAGSRRRGGPAARVGGETAIGQVEHQVVRAALGRQAEPQTPVLRPLPHERRPPDQLPPPPPPREAAGVRAGPGAGPPRSGRGSRSRGCRRPPASRPPARTRGTAGCSGHPRGPPAPVRNRNARGRGRGAGAGTPSATPGRPG